MDLSAPLAGSTRPEKRQAWPDPNVRCERGEDCVYVGVDPCEKASTSRKRVGFLVHVLSCLVLCSVHALDAM